MDVQSWIRGRTVGNWGGRAGSIVPRWGAACCAPTMFGEDLRRALRGGGDPPQDSGDDAPAGAFAQDYGLVFAVFGLENIEFGIAAQARNTQTLVFIGYDHDFSVKIGAIGLGRVHGGDVAVVNQRLHRMATDAKETGVARIGAPLYGRAHYFARRNVVQVAVAVALASVGANRGLQDRNGNDLGSACGVLFCSATCGCEFHLFFGARGNLLAFALAEHMHDVAGLQAGASPVKPAVLLAGEFTEFDVITRGGS